MADDTQKLDARVMGPVFIVVAIDAMGMGVVLPLLPFYSRHFGATPFTIGVLISTFAFCQFLSGPWLGRQSDRYGRKPILLISQLGTCLSFILLACANSLTLVFAARIFAGLTAGNMSVATAWILACERRRRFQKISRESAPFPSPTNTMAPLTRLSTMVK